MITVSNLSIQYGGVFLFDDISYTITTKDRVGLVGKNGAGKSTMLKILLDEIRPETGSVAMDNKTTLGYLPQEMAFTSQKTVYEEAVTAFDKVLELENNIKKITEEIANCTDYDSDYYYKLLNRLTDAQEQLQNIGGLTVREDVENWAAQKADEIQQLQSNEQFRKEFLNHFHQRIVLGYHFHHRAYLCEHIYQ